MGNVWLFSPGWHSILRVMAAEYSYLNGPALNNGTHLAVYANRQLANILGRTDGARR